MCAGHKTLMGHSFGGVFNFYALVHEPALFQAHVAASPAVWWDQGLPQAGTRTCHLEANSLVCGQELRQQLLRIADATPKLSFFHALAGEGGTFLASNLRTVAAVEEALGRRHQGIVSGSGDGAWSITNQKMRYKFVPMYNESHSSISHRAFHSGLEWIYRDYKREAKGS